VAWCSFSTRNDSSGRKAKRRAYAYLEDDAAAGETGDQQTSGAFHFMNPSKSSTDPCSLLLGKMQAKQFSSDACKVTAGRSSFSVTS